MAKKIAKKSASKKAPAKKKPVEKKQKHEIVVRVESQPVSNLPMIPTVTDLSEPMKDGKKLTLPKSWLTSDQLVQMVQRTPAQHVYKRKGKGGQEFSYVTGAYVEKTLNFVFAWNWDFEILSHGQEGGFIWVLGKLTVRGGTAGQSISKSQFGRAEIKKLKVGGMLDFGNDLKAASTDALKKCASLLGIASDIYGKSEYKSETGVEPRDPQKPAAPAGRHYDATDSQEIPAGEKVVGPDGKPTHVCAVCGDPITDPGYKFSMKLFKRALCREHAQLAGKK